MAVGETALAHLKLGSRFALPVRVPATNETVVCVCEPQTWGRRFRLALGYGCKK